MSAGEEHAFVVEGKMALPYQYFAGTVGSKFLVALRDEKKILGIRCDKCNKVFIPPRATCERCFSDLTDEWVELPGTGIVTGFTVIRYEEPYQPKKPPYVLALIKLDGADTPLVHLLECGDPLQAQIGMKVKAVFAEKRTGSILDITHFAPVPERTP
jgi:uncharacterized OB-fold protein